MMINKFSRDDQYPASAVINKFSRLDAKLLIIEQLIINYPAFDNSLKILVLPARAIKTIYKRISLLSL